MILKRYSLLLLLVLFTLTACSPTGPTTATKPDDTAVMQAMTAEQDGDYLAAAQQYLALAESSAGAQQAQFYLRAATSFWKITQFDQTADSLAKIDRDELSESQQLDVAIIEADMALSQLHSQTALNILAPFNIQLADPAQQQAALEIKIRAYGQDKNWLAKAKAQIMFASLLNSNIDRKKSQEDLWQTLMLLSPESLELDNPSTPPAVDSGWFALAYIVKSYQSNPTTLAIALEDWHRSYPNHPADPALYENVLNAGTQLPQNLADIAILLPDSGPYKIAADAIKQGIIAAHFDARSTTRLHFFNVETDPRTGASNVWQQYQQAIAQNASLVIGPLDKKSIQILADAKQLEIPVLALNRLANQTQKQNLFQFGLAPEDDAISVANYAADQGYQRTLVLAPQGDWGKRIATAFDQQWTENGGIVLDQINYNANQSDFSATLKPLLGIEASEQRSKTLKQTLALSIEFEPRRRQDIDFLFLVAKPLKARQLVPQLKFHRSGQMPIIATSHAYSGQKNSQQDIDLNGLVINDIPWVFSNVTSADPAYIALHTNPPQNFDSYIRLYALGVDAYRLIPDLNNLSRSSDVVFKGATGELSIDQAGHIKRETYWAKFSNGILYQSH